eukprot:767320-Hanusia_phi.AAC.11
MLSPLQLCSGHSLRSDDHVQHEMKARQPCSGSCSSGLVLPYVSYSQRLSHVSSDFVLPSRIEGCHHTVTAPALMVRGEVVRRALGYRKQGGSSRRPVAMVGFRQVFVCVHDFDEVLLGCSSEKTFCDSTERRENA